MTDHLRGQLRLEGDVSGGETITMLDLIIFCLFFHRKAKTEGRSVV